jgi:putative FmdB family regulatory protein
VIYPYKCTECGHKFEVIKSVKDIDTPERCPKCCTKSERYIARTHFYGAGDWDKAAYNPAFGKIIRSKAHLREELSIAASEGREMVEIGNEPVDNIHKDMDRKREERAAERWREADRELGLA